jgi:hypothetical protein
MTAGAEEMDTAEEEEDEGGEEAMPPMPPKVNQVPCAGAHSCQCHEPAGWLACLSLFKEKGEVDMCLLQAKLVPCYELQKTDSSGYGCLLCIHMHATKYQICA